VHARLVPKDLTRDPRRPCSRLIDQVDDQHALLFALSGCHNPTGAHADCVTRILLVVSEAWLEARP